MLAGFLVPILNIMWSLFIYQVQWEKLTMSCPSKKDRNILSKLKENENMVELQVENVFKFKKDSFEKTLESSNL